MVSIKRPLRVWLKDSWHEDGHFEYPRNFKLATDYSAHRRERVVQLSNTTLFCPECRGVWAVIDFGTAGIKYGSCKHTFCREHGGIGLLSPFQIHNVKIELPLEVYKNDFLILMEDNKWPDRGMEYPLVVPTGFYSDIIFGFPNSILASPPHLRITDYER